MKVLLIASGKTATQINKIDTSQFDKIVVVNNAWQVTDKWNYWVHPNDYKGKSPVLREGDPRVVSNYSKVLNSYGGHKACGYSIVLCASYWVLSKLSPSEIYYLGCDMNYEPSKDGSTAFYGTGFDIASRGVSDPDAMAKKWKQDGMEDDDYIKQIYLRFKHIAEEQGCQVWNASRIDETKTRLPYPPKHLD